MTNCVEAYRRIALSGKLHKWNSIHMQEHVRFMTLKQCQSLHDELKPILVEEAKSRLAKFQQLNAPKVVLDNQQRFVESIERGKDPRLHILLREISKHSKESKR